MTGFIAARLAAPIRRAMAQLLDLGAATIDVRPAECAPLSALVVTVDDIEVYTATYNHETREVEQVWNRVGLLECGLDVWRVTDGAPIP